MQISESPIPYRISTKFVKEFMEQTEKPIYGLMETTPYHYDKIRIAL
jgi:hypothetical protein